MTFPGRKPVFFFFFLRSVIITNYIDNKLYKNECYTLFNFTNLFLQTCFEEVSISTHPLVSEITAHNKEHFFVFPTAHTRIMSSHALCFELLFH